MDTVEIVPLVTAAIVLAKLEKGLIDKAIFPVMNNNGGIVREAMHAMAKHVFAIETMFEMDIHHLLLVCGGIKEEDITRVTSHEQALAPCRGYLEREWDGVEVFPYKDTAAAAADLAHGVLPSTTAVIASRVAAELYGLCIFASGVQDAAINRTTFVVAIQQS